MEQAESGIDAHQGCMPDGDENQKRGGGILHVTGGLAQGVSENRKTDTFDERSVTLTPFLRIGGNGCGAGCCIDASQAESVNSSNRG